METQSRVTEIVVIGNGLGNGLPVAIAQCDRGETTGRFQRPTGLRLGKKPLRELNFGIGIAD
jgi:hypothetical protein